MTSGTSSDRRPLYVQLPLPLFNRMQDIGGVKRSHGFFTETIVAALEEYLPKFEKPRTQDVKEGTTWLDQLIEDTIHKKRGRK